MKKIELRDAIARKIFKIVDEQETTVTGLANMAGICPNYLLRTTQMKHDTQVRTILKICEFLDISLEEFFDDPIFVGVVSYIPGGKSDDSERS